MTTTTNSQRPVAVVTGAGRGLGRKIAERLGRRGIHVGFPYVTQFIMERNAKRLAEQTAFKAAETAKAPATEPVVKVAEEAEALLN